MQNNHGNYHINHKYFKGVPETTSTMAEEVKAPQTEEEYSCGRRIASKINSDEWLNLVEAHTVKEEELHKRLESNWTAVAGVSGLITGFTYVVSNTDITFGQDGPLSEYRHDLFGLFSMLSFLTALQATLFSAGLFGMINLLGEENTNWFVQQNWYIIDLPLICCIVSIALMLISALISIGGIVSNWVYYTILTVGVVAGLGFMITFTRIQRQMYQRTVMLKNRRRMESQIGNGGVSRENDDVDTLMGSSNDKTD